MFYKGFTIKALYKSFRKKVECSHMFIFLTILRLGALCTFEMWLDELPKSHLLIHNQWDSLLNQNVMNLVWFQQINYIKIMN